jgi:hypothetical protein
MLDSKALIEEKGLDLVKNFQGPTNNDEYCWPYLFISFDLINSTSYKSQNLDWLDVFNAFMVSCSENLLKCITDEKMVVI